MFSKSFFVAFLYLSCVSSAFAAPTSDSFGGIKPKGSNNQASKSDDSTAQCSVRKLSSLGFRSSLTRAFRLPSRRSL